MSTPPDRFDPEQAAKFFFRHGHSGWLGLRYRDHGENWVELELPWRNSLSNQQDCNAGDTDVPVFQSSSAHFVLGLDT